MTLSKPLNAEDFDISRHGRFLAPLSLPRARGHIEHEYFADKLDTAVVKSTFLCFMRHLFFFHDFVTGRGWRVSRRASLRDDENALYNFFDVNFS